LELTGKKTPQAGLEGKFSVYHSAAAAIIHGDAGENQYSDACVRDPAVIALRDKVTATADNKVREDETHITILLKGGGKLTKHVEHAIGSVERPMSDAALEAKFHHLADGMLPAPQIDKLIGLCRSLTDLADAGAVARAAVKGAK
jgi:2-methylcitrate dehydratase PrpD